MNSEDRREAKQSICVLGWLYIAANTLLLILGGVVFLLLFGLGYASCEWESFSILAGLGFFLGGLLILLGFLGILAGIGLLRFCAWGRILALIVAVLGLIVFPLGTIIGIYALIVLLQEDVIACCGSGSRLGRIIVEPCKPNPCEPDPCAPKA